MWSNDSANTTTLTNDTPAEKGVLTIDDMVIAIDAGERTLDDPRSPWKKDAINTVIIPVNDTANL